ncbi:unnamed protein product, partial [Polarella glacialis]
DFWEVEALCFTRAQGSSRPLRVYDLSQEGEVVKLVESFRPHVVVHLAADEVLSRDPKGTAALNVGATAALAQACERIGSWLVFVSCDQVFSGNAPPYDEDAEPDPETPLGFQKLRAEQLVTSISPGAAILRVPVLYGFADFLRESTVTGLLADLNDGLRHADDRHLRYPTNAADVVGVLRAMIELHFNGTELKGIFHWQCGEQYTLYEMMCLMADLCGFAQPGIILPGCDPEMPDRLNIQDRRLRCSRLELLIDGSKFRTPLSQGLQQCLRPFMQLQERHPRPSTSLSTLTPRLSTQTLSLSGGTSGGSWVPFVATGGQRHPLAPGGRAAILRRQLRSTSMVLHQTSAEVSKLRKIRDLVREEADRLQRKQSCTLSSTQEQLQKLTQREQFLSEAVQAKMRDEAMTEEMVAEMERELQVDRPSSPSSEPGICSHFISTPFDRRHSRSQDFSEVSDSPTSASMNGIGGPRQPRAESPAFDSEVLKLKQANEGELQRLREENARLRALVHKKGLGSGFGLETGASARSSRCLPESGCLGR